MYGKISITVPRDDFFEWGQVMVTAQPLVLGVAARLLEELHTKTRSQGSGRDREVGKVP